MGAQVPVRLKKAGNAKAQNAPKFIRRINLPIEIQKKKKKE